MDDASSTACRNPSERKQRVLLESGTCQCAINSSSRDHRKGESCWSVGERPCRYKEEVFIWTLSRGDPFPSVIHLWPCHVVIASSTKLFKWVQFAPFAQSCTCRKPSLSKVSFTTLSARKPPSSPSRVRPHWTPSTRPARLSIGRLDPLCCAASPNAIRVCLLGEQVAPPAVCLIGPRRIAIGCHPHKQTNATGWNAAQHLDVSCN